MISVDSAAICRVKDGFTESNMVTRLSIVRLNSWSKVSGVGVWHTGYQRDDLSLSQGTREMILDYQDTSVMILDYQGTGVMILD